MSVVQNNSVGETSNLQTELERTKERFENCIIKKENEYVKIWNDWYKKCEECKFDKISYDKAYNDMQKKIECLQAQLRDLKNKSKDTSCASDTLNPLSQKLEIKNMELEFQDNTHGTSTNTKFAKQSILGKPPKLDETHALSKPVTSNSIPTPQESKVMKNDKVIASGMFRISPFKISREEKHVPNKFRASVRTKPITVTQPPVFTKKDVNSDSNGLSFTGIDNTKTRRPQPRSNTKNDRVPSAVYFVEGLGHNLFSVGQFCDSDIDVAFRRNACFVRNLEGVDLLSRNRTTNLYTINLHDVASASPICLMARASSTNAAESSSSQYVDPSNMHTFYQPYPHEFQWTKDHPLEQVIGEPSRPVLTRNQLRSDGDMCIYVLTMSTMEPKNVKEAMTDPTRIKSMQEELLQFKRMDNDEENKVIRNKSRLVVKGYRQEEGLDFEESFAPNHFFKGTTDPMLFIRRFDNDILVAKPTKKHLEEVKRIFHYLWGTVNTSLWYTKDSGFELTGFLDANYAGCKDTFKNANYAGCKDTFKSTFGEAQFLGEKLVSCSSKKQDCTALSTAKAEYVSLSACCAQVLWM
nr:uncharacterized mitochondrial protein AtMg00810-like [Tanacetum cinerariifolium]